MFFMDFEKVEQEKVKKVNEIFQLCMEINAFEHRQRSITGNKPTVFFNFLGHIASLEVEIFETGWIKNEKANKKFCIYLDNYFKQISGFEEAEEDEEIQIKAELDNCIQYLKWVKEEKYEHLQQVI